MRSLPTGAFAAFPSAASTHFLLSFRNCARVEGIQRPGNTATLMQATQLPSLRQSLCRSSLVKPSQQAACQSRSCQPVWQKSRRQAGLVRAVADDSTDTFDGNDVVSSYRAAGPPVDQDPAEASPRCTEVVTPEVMQPVLLGQRGHSRIRRAATWTGRAGLTLLAAAAFPGKILSFKNGVQVVGDPDP